LSANQSFFTRYKGLIILGAIILVVGFFCGFLPFNLPAIQNGWGIPPAARPVVQLPAERLTDKPLIDLPGELNDIYLTNTIVATILVDLILILLALAARIGYSEIPKGVSNLFEMAVEALYGIAEQVVGPKTAPRIFPIAGTIFLFLLIGNWMEFIPGVDSVGLLHHAEAGHGGHAAKTWNGIQVLDVQAGCVGGVDPAKAAALPADDKCAAVVKAAAAAPAAAGATASEGTEPTLYVVTPVVRPIATDINVPLGLAFIAFVTIQVFGAIGLGWGYAAKFVNTPGLARGGMGIMDFGVGLFELVLEPVKIISLTFRLLGNVFGGSILLFVISTLIAYLVPVALYGYELFIGAIQAYVFMMLTLVFSAMAAAGHGGDEHH
jgi:F-type H+-transporting ATPase subunit a